MKRQINLIIRLWLCLSLSGITARAQETGDALRDSLSRLQKILPAERLFIHLDRPAYLTGETIWFSVHAVPDEGKPKDFKSRIAYVEVLDGANKRVLSGKVKLDKGRGAGSFIVPASVANGEYTVRGYTSWMKNFPADSYFQSTINFLNPFTKPAPTSAGREPAYDLQFFPEGGDLLAGVETKVAFRITDQTGKGVALHGVLVNNRGDTLANFSPKKYGIGSVTVTADNSPTKAFLTDSSGKTHTFDFPRAMQHGSSLKLIEEGNRLKLYISGTAPAAPVHVLAHSITGRAIAKSARLENGTAVIDLEKAALADGVNRITVFDESLTPTCERLWFKYPKEKRTLNVAVDKPSYSTKQKVKISVSAKADNQPLSADFSVAVYLEDSLPKANTESVSTWYWLTSHLSGAIENANEYLSNDDADAKAALDNLLLTHGWSRFSWKDILSSGVPKVKFLPEYGGHFVQGKATDKTTGEPKARIPVFLATPSAKVQLFDAQTDSEGRFTFEIKELPGPREIVVQNDWSRDKNVQLTIDDPFSGQFTKRSLNAVTADKSWVDAFLSRSIDMQLMNSFHPNSPVFTPDSSTFYGKPSQQYYLDQYTRFPTMDEVLREYVWNVLVRVRQGKKMLVVASDKVKNEIYNTEPLMLLDGAPIFDSEKVLALDPLKVKRLDVMAGVYYLGPLLFHGIVSFSTYSGDLAGYEIGPEALLMAYEGPQITREFYSPKYDSPEAMANPKPDFRNLLYWNSALVTDSSGKAGLEFYSSEKTGKYLIVIQGLGEDGKPLNAINKVNVKAEIN